jgi:hypothetical protein
MPWTLHAALAARVCELHGGHRALRLQERSDARDRRHVRIGPDAEIAVGDAAVGFNGGGLCEDEAGAADRKLGEVGEVPVVGQSVPGESTGTSAR